MISTLLVTPPTDLKLYCFMKSTMFVQYQSMATVHISSTKSTMVMGLTSYNYELANYMHLRKHADKMSNANMSNYICNQIPDYPHTNTHNKYSYTHTTHRLTHHTHAHIHHTPTAYTPHPMLLHCLYLGLP